MLYYKFVVRFSKPLQKQPTIQGKGCPRRPRKYSGAKLARILSSLVVNKHLDTMDTRLIELETPLVQNLLEDKLGFHQFRRYEQAVNGQNFAYDKIEDLWTIDIDSDSESDEEEEIMSDQTMVHEESTSEEHATSSYTLEELNELYETIKKSKDKAVIIKMQAETHDKCKRLLGLPGQR